MDVSPKNKISSCNLQFVLQNSSEMKQITRSQTDKNLKLNFYISHSNVHLKFELKLVTKSQDIEDINTPEMKTIMDSVDFRHTGIIIILAL